MDSTIESQIMAFKALGNVNRVKIIRLLAQHEELCVCEVVTALKRGQSLASYHLSVLEKTGMLTSRWEGTWTYYKLNEEKLIEVMSPQYFKALLR